MKRVLRFIERTAHTVGFLLAIIAIVWIGVLVGRPAEKSGSQPTFAGADQKQKRLVVYLDGTWNSVDSNTNVWRMRALTAAKGKDDRPQLVYYSVGVNGVLGGVFGQGLDDNIRLAYEWLIENYNEGDEIFIFGFSRGAYTARALAGLIAIDGVLKAGSPIGVAELFARYRKGNEETIWRLREMQASGEASKLTEQERWLLKYSNPADVKMIGVWDTVGSVGLAAGNIEGISRSQFDYLQTGLRIHILNGYHALAVDEHRRDFAPTLWTVRHPKEPKAVIAQPRPLSAVEQRWFVGAHANVGGGYETDLLNQAPLRWLMKKAESHGLTFRTEVELEGDSLAAPIADSYGKFGYGLYRWITSPFYRPIGAEAEERDDGTHPTVNETIDVSVFDRWRADPAYRPVNLVDWAKRKNLDPGRLQTSVQAANPQSSAPD
ncbi:phospholipase effector Tle1 domain-containing protein [Bradyrhizobium sp. HKCCYLS2038]|uniref:phospholipase effector Tle1 domain-containing protein n=1 Tax=unclassified Bradyrhizobium TaxID=2631580 RepID=UPI003EB742BA